MRPRRIRKRSTSRSSTGRSRSSDALWKRRKKLLRQRRNASHSDLRPVGSRECRRNSPAAEGIFRSLYVSRNAPAAAARRWRPRAADRPSAHPSSRHYSSEVRTCHSAASDMAIRTTPASLSIIAHPSATSDRSTTCLDPKHVREVHQHPAALGASEPAGPAGVLFSHAHDSAREGRRLVPADGQFSAEYSAFSRHWLPEFYATRRLGGQRDLRSAAWSHGLPSRSRRRRSTSARISACGGSSGMSGSLHSATTSRGTEPLGVRYALCRAAT